MKLHAIIHESFETLGAIETWAHQNKHSLAYSRVYEGDKLPNSVDDFDFLFVMGGPQSPSTTLEECPHFDAKAEIELIRRAADADKKILGVCLGAQLIGEAFSASYEHSPNKEIGVFNLHLTAEAAHDPIFSTFPKIFPVGHWHGDMPGLAKDSILLAYSEGCPRQIIRYAPKVYGFQCHFEFTPEAIENMLEHCGKEIVSRPDRPYIQSSAELRQHDYQIMNEFLFKFLDYFIKVK